MIVCGHSAVEKVNGGWRVRIDAKVGSILDLFPGQTLFGGSAEGSSRLFLSSLRLNPHVSYFRIFLEDFRGSLATVTQLFSDKNINILSGGAFSFGNIWVSEIIADFKGIDATSETIVDELESLGGFVTAREITELFPRAFELESPYELKSDDKGMYLLLQNLPSGIPQNDSVFTILKAWPQVRTLFIDFLTDSRLLKIMAKISDVPGSLNKLASLLKTQVNLHAIHEQHHDEASGEWTIYGVLELGTIDELRQRARDVPTILELKLEPLG